MSDIVLPNFASLTAGLPRDVTELIENFDACAAVINGDLDNGNFAADAGIRDSKLQAPNNAQWKTVLRANAVMVGIVSPGLAWFTAKGGAMLFSGSSPALAAVPALGWHITDVFNTVSENTIFAVANKTRKMRVGLVMAVNSASAPNGVSFFGHAALAECNALGAAAFTHINNFGFTPAILSPAAGAITGPVWSAEFDVPTGNPFNRMVAPLFFFSGNQIPNGCVVQAEVLIQVRNV